MKTLLPQRIEGVQSPRNADERTLRMCFTEQDAICASIVLSGLTYREIAARMGKSKTLVDAMAKGRRGLTERNTAAFCHATGTLLIRQFRDFERARRIAAGIERNRDRIAQIASYSQSAAA